MDMNSFLHTRTFYDGRIQPWVGKPVIKVLTGMRRVGKSCVLRQAASLLHTAGLPHKRILFVDKEDQAFDEIRDHRHLAAWIKKRAPSGRAALLVDEVQEIEGWERVVNSCLKEGRFDIYVTGSNARMLSSDLATLLSGRYVEIPIFPLSLPEFLQFQAEPPARAQDLFPAFLRYGGLPALQQLSDDEHSRYQYLSSVFDTIVLKDIIARHEVRNVPLFQNICRFAFDNAGQLFSAKRVADYLKSQRLAVTVDTVQRYMGYLCDAFVFHRVRRFDLRGKRHLEINDKYYPGDIGLRHAVLGYRQDAINGMLETLVFQELLRRGYTVSVGKLGAKEIDFVADRGKERLYVQVAYLMPTADTREREFVVLEDVRDNHPKLVLSLDPVAVEHPGGIRHAHIVDFLMEG
jgi:predicted AAA+ superfamily ATPase